MKKALLLLIAALPFNKARIAAYRWLCGYEISWDSYIGPANWIEAESCRISAARVGIGNIIQAKHVELRAGSGLRRGNKVRYLEKIVLMEGAVILSGNTISGTRGDWSPYKGEEKVSVGPRSIITADHYIDACCGVDIGEDVTLAGSGIQIWTHGFDLKHTMILAPVSIGDHVYIGSRSLILQGTTITGGVSIGAGTVVSRSIEEPGFYTSSHLIRKADVADYSEHEQVVIRDSARYVRKSKTASRSATVAGKRAATTVEEESPV